MKCTIIRDLLPLYCDGLTSEDSAAAVEEHLRECTECTEIYAKMTADSGVTIPEADKDIEPIKRIKKSSLRRFLKGIIFTAAACLLIFGTIVYGIIPMSSKDIRWTAEIEEQEVVRCEVDADDEPIPGTETTELHTMVLVSFNLPRNARVKEPRSPEVEYGDGWVHVNAEMTLYGSLLPYAEKRFALGNEVIPEQDPYGATVTIHCRDKDLVLNYNELAELCRQNGGHYSSDD